MPIYEVGECEGQGIFSMRFVEGFTTAGTPKQCIDELKALRKQFAGRIHWIQVVTCFSKSNFRSVEEIVRFVQGIDGVKHAFTMTRSSSDNTYGIDEQGTHAELMAMNGSYARLYNMQFNQPLTGGAFSTEKTSVSS